MGFFWTPIGVAAAIGLVAYFLLAIGAHIRAGDTKHIATPIVMELLAVAALILLLGDSETWEPSPPPDSNR